MRAEIGSTEDFWLERELIERGAYLADDLLPLDYEMDAIIESAYGPWSPDTFD